MQQFLSSGIPYIFHPLAFLKFYTRKPLFLHAGLKSFLKKYLDPFYPQCYIVAISEVCHSA